MTARQCEQQELADDSPDRTYTLTGPDGKPYQSATPGTLGGYKPRKIYGRLDCSSALRYLAKGQYARHRVFFADEETAIAAGYRPCARCMPERYRVWKEQQDRVGHLGAESQQPE
ncbi:MAG: metal-binding protein [Thermomicrobiales bacterium]|nr:metal-binding protein [Thermomicrobiales bacterium]